MTRFHPFWALIEMTMGIVAARHVMLDTEEDKKKGTTQLGLNALKVSWSVLPRFSILQPRNPLWLFLAAYASLGLRLTKFDFNDGLSDLPPKRVFFWETGSPSVGMDGI